MPIVELVAKRAVERNPGLGLSVTDMIVLLWIYSNPYETKRRQLSSMKSVLRMTDLVQTAGNAVEVTDEELTQIVLGSIHRLKELGYVSIVSAGRIFVRGTLTHKGLRLVEESFPTPILKRVTEEFGDNR
ncbi:MAG: hypothetical protein QXS20_04505 [Candidatus Thorarchaeota archaeon]